MAAFNFPATNGQPTDGSYKYDTGTGIIYSWNGTTWTVDADGAGGGGASIEIGATPPAGAEQGDLWWNTNDGKLYVYYVQADGREQWVESTPGDTFNGGQVDNSITQPPRTITTEFDLSTGPYWLAGAIDIPNPTNAVTGMTGTIRFTAAPTSWDSNFKHAGGAWTQPSAFPAIAPFYVQSPTEIEVGLATSGIA